MSHCCDLLQQVSDKDDEDDELQDKQEDKNKKPEKQMLKCQCTDRCKLLSENDIKAIN